MAPRSSATPALSPKDAHLAGPPPKPRRCKGKTKAGARCKKRALAGADRCATHLGAPVGRKTKLTEDISEGICAILSFGGYVETAAAAVGVSKKTFYEWLKRGDPDGTRAVDAPYRAFREQIEKSRAEGESALVAVIRNAAVKDWKAAAWMLERQTPDKWAGPRGRGITSTIHPDDFAAGETSSPQSVNDDQVGPDGRPL